MGKDKKSKDSYSFDSKDSLDSKQVLCPGKNKKDYCDCDGDCNGNPSFCECEEAKKCCKKRKKEKKRDGKKDKKSKDSHSFDSKDSLDSKQVLCPGKNQEDFCDCDG